MQFNLLLQYSSSSFFFILTRKSASANLEYEFSYTIYPFGFAVTRVSTNEVLFNTTITAQPAFNGLIVNSLFIQLIYNRQFEDQYIEISTQLPSNDDRNIYGLGEHIIPLKLTNNDTLTLWNAGTLFSLPFLIKRPRHSCSQKSIRIAPFLLGFTLSNRKRSWCLSFEQQRHGHSSSRIVHYL